MFIGNTTFTPFYAFENVCLTGSHIMRYGNQSLVSEPGVGAESMPYDQLCLPALGVLAGMTWCAQGVTKMCAASEEESFSAQRQRGRESLCCLAIGVTAIAGSIFALL